MFDSVRKGQVFDLTNFKLFVEIPFNRKWPENKHLWPRVVHFVKRLYFDIMNDWQIAEK